MGTLRRRTRRLAALLPLVAGLLVGTGVGLPLAHWVAGVLAHPAALAAAGSSGRGASSSPAAVPSPAGSPLPSGGVVTAGAAPAPAPPVCAALANGQSPLEPLRSAPSGYSADPALDWVGCGSETVPASSPFTIDATWLVAVSYTCPTGTAAQATSSTLSVNEVAPTYTSGSGPVLQSRADAAGVIDGGANGAGLDPGTWWLTVATPPSCLWHLAVYRA